MSRKDLDIIIGHVVRIKDDERAYLISAMLKIQSTGYMPKPDVHSLPKRRYYRLVMEFQAFENLANSCLVFCKNVEMKADGFYSNYLHADYIYEQVTYKLNIRKPHGRL
jgi:hypothetical protein